ncbi:lipopolysaccharide biosynthesis protein [Vibrio splendidus]
MSIVKGVSFKSLFSYSSCILLKKLSAFILLPLVAKTLSVQEFGQVNQILAVSNLCILFITFGLDESISKKIYNGQNLSDVYSNGIFIVLVHFIILIFVNEYFDIYQMDGGISRFLVFSCLSYVGFSTIVNIYLKVCRLNNNLNHFVKLSLTSILVQFLLVYIFVVFMNGGISSYFSAFALTAAIAFFYSVFSVKKYLNLRAINFSFAKEIYKYGAKVAPHTISSWGLLGFTISFVGIYLGSEDTAKFVANNYVSVLISTMSFAFLYTYQPWLYDHLKNKSEIKYIIKQVLIFSSLGFVFSFLVMLISPYLFYFIFDDRYSYDFLLSSILIFSVFFQFLGSMFTYFLYYYEDVTLYVSISTFFGVVVNVSAFLIFISDYGLLAAAGSYLLSQTSVFIFRFYVFYSKVYKGGVVDGV